MGIGEAPLPPARRRRADHRLHGRRDRRHVGRRVRQRNAAVRSTSSSSPRSTTGTSSSIPNPDAAASFAERSRLFALPRSSWDDYDRALISAGGGVFPRTAKAIPVTPEVRARLGIADGVEVLTPAAMIQHILRAPVDLLWNGGIGTYREGDARRRTPTSGDKANDAVRVNGAESAVPRRRRGRQPRLHAAGPRRVRARWRTDQHRRDRQQRRRRHCRTTR